MTAIVLPALKGGETLVVERARMTAEPAADIESSATEKYFGRVARIHDIAAAHSVRKTSCPNGYPVVDLKISCSGTNQHNWRKRDGGRKTTSERIRRRAKDRY